ncbi:MAG: hypothetical protein XXXJIFNMEKO3_02287 [Candidatus Erwinia impunctatus]|nr:hypothetical protein XXXJIFNMEKO_02287 [Culicoides impunctatus]
MSVDIWQTRETEATVRRLWLWRLRRSKTFTLSALMCCMALLWVSPFLWMLSSAFSVSSFGNDMASVLPRFPLTFSNFTDAWQSANWLSLYSNTLILLSVLLPCSC